MSSFSFFLCSPIFFVLVFPIGVADLLLMGAFRCAFDLDMVFMYDWGFPTNWKHHHFLDSKLFLSFSPSLCFLIFSHFLYSFVWPWSYSSFRCTFDGLWLTLFCWVFNFSIAMLLLCISIFFFFLLHQLHFFPYISFDL